MQAFLLLQNDASQLQRGDERLRVRRCCESRPAWRSQFVSVRLDQLHAATNACKLAALGAGLEFVRPARLTLAEVLQLRRGMASVGSFV